MLKKTIVTSINVVPNSEVIKSEPDTDGTVSIVCEESADLPLLTSDSKYVFNENHEAEFVQYYKENNQEITKTAFLRYFSEKWHMSEHPLLRRLEEWIGKNYSFSTEYCTAKMTKEMLVFYLENRAELTEDEALGAKLPFDSQRLARKLRQSDLMVLANLCFCLI